jgi:hypothetical protein
MRHVRTVVMLLSVFAALPAYAGPPFACCYCTSPQSGNQALLCEAVPSGDMTPFQTQCEAKGGDTFPCVAALSPDACPGVFQTAGIVCPQIPGAPVLGSAATAVLAATLLGLGVIGSRARRRQKPRL